VPEPSAPRPVLRSIAAALAAVVLAAVVAGCGSTAGSTTDPAEVPGATATTSAPDPGGPTGTSGYGTVVLAEQVTCVLAPRSGFGAVVGVAAAPVVPCDQPHNNESFSLPESDQLDDCFRAAAASSDLKLGVSSSTTRDLAFDDKRVVGHIFASGETSGVDCSIDLRDDRSGALIGG
jgi:hypothetical protein